MNPDGTEIPTPDFDPVIATLRARFQFALQDARLLKMIIEEKSNKEIADDMHVRVGTVKSRVYRLFKALNVKNRAGAAVAGARACWMNGVNI